MIWLVSEVYHPDEDGTAFYMTRLAEYLAADRRVGVICGFPKRTARGAIVPKRQVRCGVEIDRCLDLGLSKNSIILRALDVCFISASMFLKALKRLRKGDIVIAVTNPPLTPLLALMACRIRGAKCILRIDDVYPEAMIAAGLLRRGGFVARMSQALSGAVYGRMSRIVVLGRDMEALVKKKIGGTSLPISVIPNWADVDSVEPLPKSGNGLARALGVQDKFVVLCAGNMGRVQAIETMFKAAEMLKSDDGIHFLFIGQGARRRWMEEEVRVKRLHNVTLLDHRPRSEQAEFLNACDISMASLIAGLDGAGVPSRMYNIMAAGKPLIAIAGPSSELVRTVKDENVGWCVPPDDPGMLAEVIRQAFMEPTKIEELGRRARQVAVEKYGPAIILARYKDLVESA